MFFRGRGFSHATQRNATRNIRTQVKSAVLGYYVTKRQRARLNVKLEYKRGVAWPQIRAEIMARP